MNLYGRCFNPLNYREQMGRFRESEAAKSSRMAGLSANRERSQARSSRQIMRAEPIRAAFIVATVDTPHRFRTKRQFWSYVGLAVVTHMSSEYEMKAGRVVRRRKPVATRGLNKNCNRRLKEVFITAATSASNRKAYGSFLNTRQESGMRPEMARLTLARKIAAMALAVWKKGEAFDPKKLNWTT
jgi:transposase